jgi:hypothetical protein
LIYSQLERELDRLCEEMGIDMSDYDRFLKLLKEGLTNTVLSERLGVGRATIRRWKDKQPRVRGAKIDYTPIDALLKEGKLSETKIAVQCGVSQKSVNRRKLHLLGSKPFKVVHDPVPYEPLIPPAERLPKAIKIKQRNLGFNTKEMQWWLGGTAGRQFMEGIQL